MTRIGDNPERRRGHPSVVVLGALVLTAAFFLVLPVIQAISATEKTFVVRKVDSGALPPPPPSVPEPEPEPEPEEEPEPPKLNEIPRLDLAQLELALNPGGFSGSWAGGLDAKLGALSNQGESMQAFFDMSDLDQKPRAVYQRSPALTPALRKKAPGKVYVSFVVNENGRVQSPRVFKSTDPAFDNPALNAVKKWKFEPGKRNGKPVSFRMRCPITFPKGSRP